MDNSQIQLQAAPIANGEPTAVPAPPPVMQSEHLEEIHHSLPNIKNMLVCSPGTNKEWSGKFRVAERAVLCWMNYHLKMKPEDREIVVDLHTDLRDGVLLQSLVVQLTGQDIPAPHNTFPMTLAQKIESINLVFSVLDKEGLQIVHHDDASRKIAEGNIKFTMEVCKSLIQHFHFTFGHSQDSTCSVSAAAHKERMFLWLKAVLPGYKAGEFTTGDWSDGRLLASLITYSTGTQHSTNELADMIGEAESTLGIPSILTPDDLDMLDGEFALLVYLYFFAKHGSPGQLKLLEWVNSLPPCKDSPVKDFQQEWTPGHLVYQVVRCLIPRSIPSLDTLMNFNALEITQEAVTVAKRVLSISPYFPASALCYPMTDPLPLIIFLCQLEAVKDVTQYSLPGSAVLIRKDVRSLYAVGSRVSIELDNLECPTSALEAVVESEVAVGRVLLEREEEPGKGITAFSFIPEHAGEFRIAITCEGSEIPDSPITFDVYDSLQCELLTAIQPLYSIGQPFTLQVSSANAGKGKITATLTAPVSPPLLSSTPSTDLPRHIMSAPPTQQCMETNSISTIEVQDLETSCIHELSFTPYQVGAHLLSIYWNDMPIRDCPVAINITGPSCTVQGVGVEEAFEGLESDFDILVPYSVCLEDADCLSVLITHRNHTCGGVRRDIKQLNDDNDKGHRKYRCSYTPPAAPSCGNSSTPPISNSCTPSCSNSSTPPIGDSCTPYNSSTPPIGDSCTPYCSDSCTPPFVPSRSNSSTSNYLLIDVKWSDYLVPGSPFLVRVHSTSPAQRCFVREYPVSHLVVGHPITAILDATKACNNRARLDKHDFKVNVTFGDFLISDSDIKRRDESENVFAIEFTPPSKDVFLMDIYYEGELIADSGLEFIIDEVVIRDCPDICYVDEPIEVTLDATSASSTAISKQGIKPLVRDAQGEDLSSSIDVDYIEENLFPMGFTPHKAGRYKMNVEVDDKAFPKGELHFDVRRPPLVNPQLSVVTFTHDHANCLVTLRLIANESVLEGFLYQQRESVGSKQQAIYHVKAVGTETGTVLQPHFRQEKNGEYAVTLTTAVPDLYSLSVHYFGDLLTCCPFPVDMCAAVTTYDPVIPFQVGTSSFIELVLDTSKTHETSAGDFKVKVLSTTTQSVIAADVSEESLDLFRAIFLPLEDDDYQINVSWFCLPIAGSPFLIPFRQRLKIPQVKVSYQPHIGPRALMEARLTLAHAECQTYSLATCTTEALLDTTVPRDSDATCLPAPGDHGGDHAGDSGDCGPANLASSEDCNPASNLPVLGDCDTESVSESYSVQNTPLPGIVLQQYKRGHYEIWFVDYQIGKYLLDVLCMPGRRIKGSPFLIDTTTVPNLPSPDGEMMKSVQICRGARYGFLAASVRGNETGPTPITIAMTPDQEEPEKAVIKFEDGIRDIYTLKLYWYNTRQYELFKGAPFLLTKHHESVVWANRDNTAI